jgi:hypothetical protein
MATVLATFAVIETPSALVRLADENCTVTPAGIPLADNVALELKLPSAVSMIAVLADVPGAAEMLDGIAASVNDAAGVTVSEIDTEVEKLPLVPRMVME